MRGAVEQWLAADSAIASFLWYFLRRSWLASRRAAEAKRSVHFYVAIQKEARRSSGKAEYIRVYSVGHD